MAAPVLAPITQQVSGRTATVPVPGGPAAAALVPSGPARGQPLAAAVAGLPVLDADGRRVPFGALFRERRAIVVFVRHFLCYTCKEYVEDLAKIPRSFLQEADVTLIVIGQSSYHHIEPFCKLTGYCHEIYVDPEREIYKRLGMKRGEEVTSSACGSPAGGLHRQTFSYPCVTDRLSHSNGPSRHGAKCWHVYP
ncbi:peroxiredoxin-like 2C isoform X5 [Pipistrellus kuhlii]|uniref:peroxiredoxin-like 2C isoform X5 n=1 Tax=Pipistrellus kuhlii TaxID=59472 RepID=UPI001E274369|nr:peroxiredoxin-like 2C isoform X5 [Pipistrellus kuhlii]